MCLSSARWDEDKTDVCHFWAGTKFHLLSRWFKKKKKTQLPTFKILKLNLKKIKNNRKRKKKDIKAGFLISLDDRRVREVCVTKA